jgi:hypothetical protein
MNWHLGLDTKIILLAAGLIFLLALVLGVWKYRQIMVADDHRAHPYVDIAHRAALLYSFATLLIAAFVELSAWPTWLNLTAAAVVAAGTSRSQQPPAAAPPPKPDVWPRPGGTLPVICGVRTLLISSSATCLSVISVSSVRNHAKRDDSVTLA